MKGLIQFILLAVILVVAPSCSDVAFNSKGGEGEVVKTCVGSACVPTTHSYSWYESGYHNACSKACGGGEETQTVECRREDDVVVADTFCTGAKPAAVRTCHMDPCANVYNWNAGNWGGTCSKTCGGGVVTRTVVCQDQTFATVADSFCSATPKPATSQACNVDPCPPTYTYSWQVTAGPCKSCGGETTTDIVECKRNDGAIVADSYCTAPKPATSRVCPTPACPIPYTYSWFTDNWSGCSQPVCGSGTQTRSVACQRDQDKVFVPENNCAAPKPGSTQACKVKDCPPPTKTVTQTEYVTPAQNQLDVIMIVDDSSSMGPDNTKLGQRMGGFISDLDALNVDYQVCITTTDIRPRPDGFAGSPLKWTGTGVYVMNSTTSNKSKVFTDTIAAIGSGYSSDEQGIKALGLMIRDFKTSGCFRDKAALTTIMISDEDERSVAGNCALSSQQCVAMTSMNYPDTLISQVHSVFDATGFKKPFVWNSIITKPGDSACEAQQDAQSSPSFPGTKYKELSDKTGGYVGSICAADYSQNLSYIKNIVFNSLPGITLNCTPIGSPTVTFDRPVTTSTTLQGNVLKFTPAVPQGTTVTITYVCPN